MVDQKGTPVVILIILILISLSLAGTVFYLFNKERAKNITLQQDLENAEIRERIAETKLQEFKKMTSTLEANLRDARDHINNTTIELEQEKDAKQRALAQVAQLKKDLEQQRGIRADLEKKFVRTQKDLEKMEVQLKNLESRKSGLEKKIEELERQAEDIELGKIVVSPEALISATTEVDLASQEKEELPLVIEGRAGGKILVVNKDYNFVVINLGSKEGVKIEDTFSVYQDNEYIGDIKVEKVHDSMSAAGFVSTEIKDKAKEGDRIVQKIE